MASTSTASDPRINDRIRAREVRLIDAEGNQLGIRPLAEALSIAQEADLDLVEVAAQGDPPVCRIMDYGKFKFDAAQRAKESRRKSSTMAVKEMKYRLKIGPGDFDTKTRKVAKFLGEGHKVKITIMFRGREMDRPQFGKALLDRLADAVADVGKVEMPPRMDGRNMLMVLAPGKRSQPKKPDSAPKPDEPLQSATGESEVVADQAEANAIETDAQQEDQQGEV